MLALFTRTSSEDSESVPGDRRPARGSYLARSVEPFAAGGATTVVNLELRCRAHNAYEAELFFGPLIAREDRAIFGEELTRSGPS